LINYQLLSQHRPPPVAPPNTLQKLPPPILPISSTVNPVFNRQCFHNIKMILEKAGSSISKVVKTTIFMVTGNSRT
ncbi:MAG TPA: Rid family hydrolase, partial [Puia sp.]|nr:Rid family hydrolase [Puia sp.]